MTMATPEPPSIAIAIPLSALPAVTVTAPPPALVTKYNAEHLGLDRRTLLEVLRGMQRDPRFADEVIVRGKLRGAPPAAILAFLKATPAARMTPPPVNDVAPADDVATVLERGGFELSTGPRVSRGRRR
jgi:hypothetical protein